MEHQLYIVASARRDGNAEQLARLAARSQARSHQRWVHLIDHPLEPFVDRRHVEGVVYAEPAGHERELLEATLWADHLIFVVPLYWYSLPADAKRYLDYWSGWQRVPGREFRARMAGKRLSVITSVSDDDLGAAAPLVQSLALTAGHLKMRQGPVLIGRGNRPGDVLGDAHAVSEARRFFATEAAAQG